ncbi:MAG: hypothetical protein R3A44_28655 [Caldilineaceae bacterium]
MQILTTGTVALACFWLIPQYGLLGAAWALIVGNAVRVLGTEMAAALRAERALARWPPLTAPSPPRAEGKMGWWRLGGAWSVLGVPVRNWRLNHDSNDYVMSYDFAVRIGRRKWQRTSAGRIIALN